MILVVRTVALWGYDRTVVFFLSTAFLEIIVSVQHLFDAYTELQVLFICKGFEIYANYEGTAWSVAPSRRELQVIGCLPTVQDQDNWPAYAGLVVGETGECDSCPRRSRVDVSSPPAQRSLG